MCIISNNMSFLYTQIYFKARMLFRSKQTLDECDQEASREELAEATAAGRRQDSLTVQGR